MSHREPMPHVLLLEGLQPDEQRTIVGATLGEYGKKLTGDQMDMLLQKREASEPLYLIIACEELRLQAQYGINGTGVATKIAELAEDVPGTLDLVLARVERDYAVWASGFSTGQHEATSTVKSMLTTLLCSRNGLRREELLELLAPGGAATLSATAWNRLYRSVEAYVKPLGETGLLKLTHQQMAIAVYKRYIKVCAAECCFVCHDWRSRCAVCICSLLTLYEPG